MQALPSVMEHNFSRVPQALIQRSSFDRSHGHKTTFDTGYLVPIFRDIALPGDTFNLRATILARLSSTALQRPIMDNMYLETFWFACPIRLIWSNFVYFMGEKANPSDNTTYLIPQMPSPTTPGIVSNTLSDYLGLPVGLAASFNFNSWWHRMYNLTWNQWFRRRAPGIRPGGAGLFSRPKHAEFGDGGYGQRPGHLHELFSFTSWQAA